VIYFIQSIDGGPIKIGHSSDPETRICTIAQSFGKGKADFRILGVTDGERPEEREIHKKFAHINLHGEWFKPTQALLDYITYWTRKSEFTHYQKNLPVTRCLPDTKAAKYVQYESDDDI